MIQALLKSGKRFNASNLTVYRDESLSPSTGIYQVAFLVGSRAGNAVTRNRIKRWMREDFRMLQDKDKIDGGFIVRFKGNGGEIDHPMLSKELEMIYKSININE